MNYSNLFHPAFPDETAWEAYIDHLLTRKPLQRFRDCVDAVYALSKDHADPENLRALTKFPGFGAIGPKLINPQSNSEQELREELEKALGFSAFNAARSVVLNQHQTDPRLIQIIWDYAVHKGFWQGNVIEPGCAMGQFALFMPRSLQKTTCISGVDIEPTSLRVASLLHPTDNWFHRSILEPQLPENYFDLAVGNVPFEDGVKRKVTSKVNIKVGLHASAIYQTMQLLKPGAMAVLITSTSTLDSVGANESNTRWRAFLALQVDLLGAVRLPMQTFREISGTEVCTDLLVLRKRESRSNDQPNWINVDEWHEVTGKTGSPVKINRYFQDHPDQMVGDACLDKLTGDKFALNWTGDTDTLFDTVRDRLFRI
jgi:hypothetical protein